MIGLYGGSFTALPAAHIHEWMRAIQQLYLAGMIAGWRCSTRPDALHPRTLDRILDICPPCTGIEVGIQSTDAAILQRAGRPPLDWTHLTNAFEHLRERGIQRTVQFLPGLPGDSCQRFLHSLETCIAQLAPHAARLYPCLVLRNTQLETLWRRGQYRPLELDSALDWCARAWRRLLGSNIEVLRMGLPNDASLRTSILAGPWHPAFGERVQATAYRLALTPWAENLAGLQIHPSERSRLLGHGGRDHPLLAHIDIQDNPQLPRQHLGIRLKNGDTPIIPVADPHAASK